MNELEIVLEKYFGDKRIIFYMTSDAISNDQFIRWTYYRKSERQRIVISIGCDDCEVEVKMFTDSEQLEQFIKLVIF